MKRVYVARSPTEAQFVVDYLKARDIEANYFQGSSGGHYWSLDAEIPIFADIADVSGNLTHEIEEFLIKGSAGVAAKPELVIAPEHDSKAEARRWSFSWRGALLALAVVAAAVCAHACYSKGPTPAFNSE